MRTVTKLLDFVLALILTAFAHQKLIAQTAVVGFSDSAHCVARGLIISNNAEELAVLGQDGVIRIWDIDKNLLVKNIRLFRGEKDLGSISTYYFDPEFRFAIIATRGDATHNANLYRVDLQQQTRISRFVADDSAEVLSLFLREKDNLLFCCTRDGRLVVRDADTLAVKHSQAFTGSSPLRQILGFGNNSLFGLTLDGTIGVWKDSSKLNAVTWKKEHSDFAQATISGELVVSASIDGSICTTDLQGKVSRILNADSSHSIAAICPSSSKKQVLVCERSTALNIKTKSKTYLLDLETKKQLRILDWNDRVRITTSPNRSHVAFLDYSGDVSIREAKDFVEKKRMKFAPPSFGWRAVSAGTNSFERLPIYWTEKFHASQIEAKMHRSFDFFNLKLSEVTERKVPIGDSVRLHTPEEAKSKWQGAPKKVPELLSVWVNGKIKTAFFVNPADEIGVIHGITFVDDTIFIATEEGFAAIGARGVPTLGTLPRARWLQNELTKCVSVIKSNDVTYLLTFDEQFIFKVWNLNGLSNILSFSPCGDQWVCWTPEGYYACSANAESLMGWHINRDIDELADFRSFEAFHKEHHDPKLIRDLWLTGDLEASYVKTRSGATTGSLKQGNSKVQSQKPVVATQHLSPEVSLKVEMDRVSNENGTFFTRKDEVEVIASGKLRSGDRITSIEIKKGRQTVYSMPENEVENLNGQFEIRKIIKLDPGLTELDVRCEASNQMYGRLSTPVRVHRMTSADQQEFRRLFILSVSVSEFTDPAFPDLKTPKMDADRIVAALDQDMSGLFIESKPKVLRIQPKTKDDFNNALLEIKKDFKSTDVLLIYWSGHGKVVDFQQTPEFVLIMPNCTADSPARLGVRATDLYHELSMFEGGRIVLVLDACHSGAVASFTNQRQLSNNVMSAAREDLRIMTMAACQSSETAEVPPSKDGGSSYFTGAILTGLAGNEQTTSVLGADSDKKTRVVLTELLPEFVRAKVRTDTRAAQEPVSAGFSIDDPTPIVKLSR